MELGPDDDVYEDVEPDAADDGDDVTHWKHLFGQVVASPWLELCVGAEVRYRVLARAGARRHGEGTRGSGGQL